MPQSKTEFYYHFVWATWRRSEFISADIERRMFRCIEAEVRKLKGMVYALNGVHDHVHLAVKLPAAVAPSRLMQQVKGVSSALAREHLVPGGLFGWQDGYAGFTVSPQNLDVVVEYISSQKQHHALGTTIPEWEECGPFVDSGDCGP